MLGAGGRGDQEPLHPQAMRAFALGMIAVIGTFFLLLPVLLSPVAWWTGARAVREIDAEPDAWSGRGLAQTGKVLGMVGTALIALVVAAVVVVVRLLVNA